MNNNLNHNLVEELYQKAIKCNSGDNHSKVSIKESGSAAFRLGCVYEKGCIVERNQKIAKEWFLYASRLGDKSAQAKILLDEISKERAEIYYELGQICEIQGFYQRSFDHYKSAADFNHTESIFKLGYFYNYAIGVDLNLTEAIKYYQYADDQGHKEARSSIDTLYNDLELFRNLYPNGCNDKNLKYWFKVSCPSNKEAYPGYIDDDGNLRVKGNLGSFLFMDGSYDVKNEVTTNMEYLELNSEHFEPKDKINLTNMDAEIFDSSPQKNQEDLAANLSDEDEKTILAGARDIFSIVFESANASLSDPNASPLSTQKRWIQC